MFSYREAARLLNVEIFLPHLSHQPTGVSMDSRSLKSGDLFVALPGQRADGHDYLERAFFKGASGALVRKKYLESHLDFEKRARGKLFNLLPVEDPAAAMSALANWHRQRFNVKAIGITGSVGKTTTKEFLHFLLRQENSVLANQGNFNNHLGLPLTLLRLQPEDRYCVAELGASHRGEIRHLANLLKPEAAILTQISPAHLEGFGTLEDVYEGKLELFDALPEGAPAVIPDDDLHLIRKAKRRNLKWVRVGSSQDADYRISDLYVESGRVFFTLQGSRRFSFRSLAPFLARNAAMAIAMAHLMGVPFERMPEAWEGLELPGGRFQQRILKNGVRLIDDGYNASPASFEKALEAFEDLEGMGRKILVFSDMLELGPEEIKYHESLGRKIGLLHFDCVLAYGRCSFSAIEVLRRDYDHPCAYHFEVASHVADYLHGFLMRDDLVLLKASRGMHIEQVGKALDSVALEKQEI